MTNEPQPIFVQMHKLWTAHASAEPYDKEEWKKLEELIIEATGTEPVEGRIRCSQCHSTGYTEYFRRRGRWWCRRCWISDARTSEKQVWNADA